MQVQGAESCSSPILSLAVFLNDVKKFQLCVASGRRPVRKEFRDGEHLVHGRACAFACACACVCVARVKSGQQEGPSELEEGGSSFKVQPTMQSGSRLD